MKTPLMFDTHQQWHRQAAATPWAWQLAPRQATTLTAAYLPRWLLVNEGCAWVTGKRRAADVAQADDIWLAAGESLALPAGTEWVLEGWPQARLSLLLEAPLALSRGRAGGGVCAAASAAACAAAWWRPSWWQPSWLRALAV